MKPRAKPPAAPSQPSARGSQLEQLERELRKSCRWLSEIKEMCHYFYPGIPCQPYVLLLLKNYREYVLGKVDDIAVESIRRVVDACNVNKQLLDFAPKVSEVIMKLREAAAKITTKTAERRNEEDEEGVEEEKRQELMKISDLLERMKLAEFVKNWAGIVETLEFYEHYDEIMDLYDAVAFESVLIRVLEDEIRKVIVARGLDMKDILSRLEY